MSDEPATSDQMPVRSADPVMVRNELSELHQYTRALFDFEAKWNGAIWATNAIAAGWMISIKTSDVTHQAAEALGVCGTMLAVNIIGIWALCQAIPRYARIADRALTLSGIDDHISDTHPLKPDVLILEFADVLKKIRLATIFLTLVWSGFAVQNAVQ